VTLPAGTFDTLVFANATDPETLRSWVAPDACGQVSFQTSAGPAGAVRSNLTAYRCQDASPASASPSPSPTSGSPTPSSGASGSPTPAATKTPGFGALAALGAAAALARSRRRS
jgi:hypothetical protein